MANRFSANILLCREITEERNFEGVFNNLILEDEVVVNFDIAIFLTNEIDEIKDEVFLLNVAFDDENGTNYHVIGTNVKSYNETGKSIEVSAYKSVEVEFTWEGLYRLEFRKCRNNIDINSLSDNDLVDFIKSCDLIQDFIFSVERNMIK